MTDEGTEVLARCRELIRYDEQTGKFTWTTRRRGLKHAGQEAGCQTNKGYVEIGIAGRRYLAHRLAWLFVYGRWPTNQIDHINRDKADNRISNLREATNSENHQNKGVSSSNTSGHLGVSWDKQTNRWAASITVNYKHIRIGRYDTREEAIAAYLSRKSELHTFSQGAMKQ